MSLSCLLCFVFSATANFNMETKRKRNVNFSKTEEELLVELVKKHEQVIENKKTDVVMWKEKESCWAQLKQNSTAPVSNKPRMLPRTVV